MFVLQAETEKHVSGEAVTNEAIAAAQVTSRPRRLMMRRRRHP